MTTWRFTFQNCQYFLTVIRFNMAMSILRLVSLLVINMAMSILRLFSLLVINMAMSILRLVSLLVINMAMSILRLVSLLVIKVSLGTSHVDYAFSQKPNNPGRKFEYRYQYANISWVYIINYRLKLKYKKK